MKVKTISKHYKEAKRLERYMKGVSHHWRIAVLLLLDESPDMTLEHISESLGGTFKNLSQHTNKLLTSGLLNKKQVGTHVIHSLSPYGKDLVRLLRRF